MTTDGLATVCATVWPSSHSAPPPSWQPSGPTSMPGPRTRNEQAQSRRQPRILPSSVRGWRRPRSPKPSTASKRDALQASIASTMSALATTNGSLSNTNAHASVQGVGIDTLQTCLGGVKNAFGQITPEEQHPGAPRTSRPSQVPARSCQEAPSTGLVYPFDFPDPSVIAGRPDLLRLRHELGGREHPDHRVHGPRPLDGRRERPAEASRPGRSPDFTWAPAVAADRREVRPLLRRRRGRERRRVHLGGDVTPAPKGLHRQVDGAARMPELARRLHRPASFIDTDGTPYLFWKSGGPGSSKIWSEQLDPSGTSFSRRDESDPAVWFRTSRGRPEPSKPRPRRHRRPLLPLLLGQRLGQRQLRRRCRHLHRPARPVQRCHRRSRSCRVGREWPVPEASRSSPTRPGTPGSPSTPGSPGRWDFPTAVTSTSAGSRSPGSAPTVATSG